MGEAAGVRAAAEGARPVTTPRAVETATAGATRPREESRAGARSKIPKMLRSGLGLAVIASLVTSAVILLGFGGARYYFSPLDVRAYTDLHPVLRPSGVVGNLLGIGGLALMVVMHVYTLRKHLGFMRRWGSLTTWLELHIFCGFFGPVLITLHTSFKFNGLISVAYWSMLAVVASGFVGRYLYVMIPRSIRGRELDGEELAARAAELKARVVDAGLGSDVADRIHAFETAVVPATAADTTWSGLAFGELAAKLRLARLRRYARRHSPDRGLVDDALATIAERAQLLRRIAYLKKTKKLFDLWRVYHKPLAIVMALIVVLHVATVAYLGYAWAM
ncbi:MAG: hypothetical protein MUC56_17575 [Thermoanaerobaculales bacterium]|jgi:hypothetical protein|nr:hypothetical protein [Thermoanaerobaculales bacterium]